MRTRPSFPRRAAWLALPTLALSALLSVGGAPWSAPPSDGTAATTSPSPAQTLEPLGRGRVERMLEGRVACLGCHVIGGRGGRIGPPLDGISDRADAAYVRAVILDPSGTIPGTLMPLQRMPARDVDRLVSHLMQVPDGQPTRGADVRPQAAPAIPAGSEEDGAMLYARHCSACHGARGDGDGWNAPALPVAPTAHSDPEAMSLRTDDALFDAVYAGAYVLDGSPRMPPFGALLSTDQIHALVRHIRELCRCAQPAWAGAS